MDKYVVLKKSDFDRFVSKLSEISKVVAPIDKGCNNFAFQEIASGQEVSMEYIPTILPPKKYYMPQQEKIQEFNKGEVAFTPVVDSEELIILGAHTCDIQAIKCLDKVFDQDPKDVNYISRKDKITLIGFECNFLCDDTAGCGVVNTFNPDGSYDLMMTDLGDNYLIHVNTDKGDALAAKVGLLTEADAAILEELKKLREEKEKIFKKEATVAKEDFKRLFEASFDSPVWEEVGKKCLSCGNCTNVCPTCYCFDIKDDINLDLNTGCRIRVWDSCQNEGFATVAGNENFREERGDRQRHRYMRKFSYPVAKFDELFCTGCGRCTRTCMAKISLKETINSLKEGR